MPMLREVNRAATTSVIPLQDFWEGRWIGSAGGVVCCRRIRANALGSGGLRPAPARKARDRSPHHCEHERAKGANAAPLQPLFSNF